MVNVARLIIRGAPLFNAAVTAAAGAPLLGRWLRRNVTVLTYTGRRSGRTFSIPVAYRRSGDEVEVGANLPDAKTWWRNFLDGGGPVTLTLDGVERAGHAVARRDADGRVIVRIRLSA